MIKVTHIIGRLTYGGAEKLLLEDRLKVAEEATPAASRMGSGSFANAGGR